ncbi:MAG TPA: dihydrolipoyl dehydrogenase [Myxococcota bacterium]|nr:dihydrolipoyl dehydrogenase [Myxococcota bacterium]
MSSKSYDCIVIGGGPGGYVAAIRARQLGLATALVEREALGGICLNWGCVPTKALLRTAELRHAIAEAKEFGLEVGELRVDFSRVIARSRAVADRLSKGVAHLMRKNKVEVFDGRGRLAGAGIVRVDAKSGEALELRAPHVVIATGARARALPGIAPDAECIWTYREAMIPAALPRSLVVVGSGAIGIEFASFYRDLGAEVTVLEVLPRILPAEDDDVSAFAERLFERRGIAIHTNARLEALERRGDGVVARFAQSGGAVEMLEAERAILAVGVVGNVEELGLEESGVQIERGHIRVDEWCRTTVPGLYAIGDVAGPPLLAHKAMHEGVLCVEHIAGYPDAHPIDRSRIPACTYSRPQIASVGYSERAAREAGYTVRVGRFPFQGNGKAIAIGEKDGMVKTVFDAATGELLGAHMVGAEVTEMIQGFGLARSLEATEAELIQAVFPHPTLSETMHEAVLAAYERALHI